MQDNILSAVRWLVDDCQPLDSLVFAFSGHGSLDTLCDEQGRDGILPCDFSQVHTRTCSHLSTLKALDLVASRGVPFVTHLIIISTCFTVV